MSGIAQTDASSPAHSEPSDPLAKPTAGVRAVPYPASDPIGRGKERALVLGGGGEWFEAWQLAYVSTLAKGGVDLIRADAVVGTSAGSVLGMDGGISRSGTHSDLMAGAKRVVVALSNGDPQYAQLSPFHSMPPLKRN